MVLNKILMIFYKSVKSYISKNGLKTNFFNGSIVINEGVKGEIFSSKLQLLF